MKMKNIINSLAVLVIAVGGLTGCATSNQCASKSACHSSGAKAAALTPPTKAEQTAMTPAQALERLKAGNARYVSGKSLPRDLAAERAATANGQFPFAVVLSCLDSRTSSELIFDQGLGDVFNARVAGNVLDDDILGSMEFGCKAAGAKLIAVVGHSKCGAVKGACAGVELGHLTGLLAKIKPAVDAVPTTGDKTSYAHVDAVARENVKLVMAQIAERSPILAELIRNGNVVVVGGMYDLDTGKVTFLD
jgi:carbonic anhydrase